MSDASHPQAPRLPWRRIFAAAVVAIGIGGAAFQPAAPAANASSTSKALQDASTAPADINPPVDGQLTTEIVLHNSGVVSADEPLEATVIVSNRTSEIVNAGELVFRIDDDTIDTRYDLNEWSTSTEILPESSLGTEVFRVNVDQVHPGTTLELPLTLPQAATDVLAESEFGARGIAVDWFTDGYVAAQGHSTFVWSVDSLANPVGISPIVPIVTELGEDSLLSAAELELLTTAEGDLTLLLDAVEGTTATLAIDPRLLVSIRSLGADAPVTAVAWLERLETLANPTFPLEFADASLTLQAQAGLDQPLEPTGFTFATSQHEFFTEVQPEPAETPPPNATGAATPGAETPGSTTQGTTEPDAADPNPTEVQPETAEPAEPSATDPAQTNSPDASTGPGATDPAATDPAATEEPILEPRPAPDLDELLAFDYTRPELAWPSEGTVSNLTALTAWGADVIVLDGDQATLSPDRSATPSSQQQINGTEVLVTDTALDDSIASAVTAVDDLEFMDASTDIATLLAVIAREAPNDARQIVTTLPREALDNPELLGDLLDQMSGNGWTEIDAIPDRAADPSILAETELVPGTYSTETIDEFVTLQTTRERGMDLTALYDNPLAVAEELQAELLRTIASPIIQTDAWVAQREAFAEFAIGGASQITIVEGSEIQLIGHESSLPLFIQNDSDRQVTVEIRLRPTTGHLTVDQVSVVTIPAGGVTRATLPVQAIANGVSGVEATIWTTTGVELPDSAEFVVNVNASLETVAVGILIGAGALLFVVGIWRTLRRRKNERAAKNAANDDESAEDEAGADRAEVGESTDSTSARAEHPRPEPTESSSDD